MQGSLDQPPIIIRSSRMTAAVLLLFAVGFVAMGIWFSISPTANHVIGYFVTAFFGISIPIIAWRLIRPDSLTLTPDGACWHSTFAIIRFRWDEVQNFRVWGGTFSTDIGYDLATGCHAPPSRFIRVATKLIGVGGSLGSGWELDADELADLLNDARARWFQSDL
jgi:hypothetical protein